MLILVIVFLLLAVLAVILALQNTAPTTVTLLAWSLHGPLALVLLVALGVGLLAAFLALSPIVARDRWTIRSLRKRRAELEAALSDYQARLNDAQDRLQQQATPKPVEAPPPLPSGSGSGPAA